MVERGVKSEQGDLFLPPGFRFHPTDEEVITSYLLQKFLNPSFSPRAMGEVNLNTCEPWDLPSKAKMGEKEWYFFCHKGMKYPTGSRANRATKEGYWKATGRDREIFKTASASADGGRELVGMKKTLVFYMGRAPRGSKTNWVMHEYRLEGKSKDNNHSNLRFNPKDEWVVCKVFNKKVEEKKAAVEYSTGTPNVSSISVDAAGDDGDDFIDSLIDPMYFHSTGSLPNNTETTMNAAVAPYNAAATTRSSAVGSFVNLPNYTFNDTTTSRNLHQAAIANSTVPTSSIGYSSSWNLLQANHAMGSSYSLHDQAMMARALGGVISPNFAGGLPSYSAAIPGISQQNSLGVSQQKLEPDYGGSYATNYLTSGAAANSTVIGKAARNLGA